MNKVELGTFVIDSRSTEYTFWIDGTYRCKQWPEEQLSLWEIRECGTSTQGPTLWVKHPCQDDRWWCCDNSELPHYQKLVHKLEELLAEKYLLTEHAVVV